MSFSDWNKIILAQFFNEAFEGQQVRLSVSRDLLDDIGIDRGGYDGFLKVLRRGPDWPVGWNGKHYFRPTTLLDRALGLYKQWQQPHLRPSAYVEPAHAAPPYLPYLAIFCLAWLADGDDPLHSNEYYDRLSVLYPQHGLGAMNMGDLRCLWEGLEQWSRGNQHEALGRFVLEQLGGHAHVGIPRSQVILTQSHYERLPRFFFMSGFRPGAIIDNNDVLTATTRHGVATLGPMLANEIIKCTDIGHAAASTITEYFEGWDGEGASTRDKVQAGAGETMTAQHRDIRLRLALNPTADNSSWNCRLFLESPWDSGKAVINAQLSRWEVTLRGMHSGPLTQPCGGSSIDATCLDFAAEFEAQGRREDVAAGSQCFCVSWRGKPLRVFNGTWIRQGGQFWLIEEDGLPAEGAAYVLVSPGCLPNWLAWCESLPHTIRVSNDFTQTGLPDGWRLFHVSGLRHLVVEHLDQFPDGSAGQARRRLMRLEGGTRVHKATVTGRVYLPYDLPKLVVDAEGDISLVVSGADYEKETTIDYDVSPAGLPGGIRQLYGFTLQPGRARVIVTARRDGIDIGNVSFGVLLDSAEVAKPPTGKYVIDHKASVTSGEGVSGLSIRTGDAKWGYPSGNYEGGMQFDSAPINGSPNKLLDALRHAGGRLPYGRFRDLAWRLSNEISIDASMETRALCNLGHLDVQSDSYGRWAFVHATPFCLYPLPWKRQQYFQLVAGGTPTLDEWKKLVDESKVRNLRTEFNAQPGYTMVPPRLCILVENLVSAEEFARAVGAEWDPVPPAWRFANWACNLEEWEAGLSWFEGKGQDPVAEFCPALFLTKDGQQANVPQSHRMFRFDDSQTGRHERYTLVYRQAGNDLRHCFARERSWGRWRTMRSLMEYAGLPDPQLPVPYTIDGGVVVPRELILPYLVARGMVACSGLVPEPLSGFQAYNEWDYQGCGFYAQRPYEGPCTRYRLVPRDIAVALLAKACALPVDFPPVKTQ